MALNNIDVQISTKANNARREVNNLKNDMRGLKKETNGVGQSITNAFKSGNIYGALQKSAIFGWIGAIKNATQAMIKATSAESDYAESLNLLNVAYDNNTESATKLISKMEKMYGLDPAGLTKQLGIYKQMTNAMGMSADASALLSENLLKMQEDVSSLYNLDIDVVASKFQSALAGQTRAVRSLGVDITQASLQQELYRLGINRSVRDLNRASKTALIYISMQRQLANANGDAANTVNHLANQVRIFKEQIAIAGRQIGAVFIPILSAVLPYLNGILMAINEIGKALLGLFGVDVNEMAKQTTSAISVAGGSVGGLGDSIDDVGNSLGGASKKAKDLKKELSGLRDFDKLNVITTPKDSSAGGGGTGGTGGGVGGGGLGGIDPDLMKWLKPYDLRDIAMEAERIKDAFLEWLKVFKPLEEPFKKLAGLTFDGLKYLWEEILKPVGKWANETLLPKVVETIASAMNAVYHVALFLQPILLNIMENVVKPLGRVLGRTIINVLDGIKTAFDAISKSPFLQYVVGSAGLIWGLTKLIGVGKSLMTLFGGTKLGASFFSFWGLLKNCVTSTGNLKEGWKQFGSTFEDVTTKSSKSILGLKINVGALQSAVTGLVTAFLGFTIVKSSLEDIQQNGIGITNTFTLIAGAAMGLVGAIQAIQSAWVVLKTLVLASDPIILAIAAIGAAITGVLYLIAEWTENTNHLSKETREAINSQNKLTQEAKKYGEELDKQRKSVEDKYAADLAQINNNEKLLNELTSMTDATGKLTKGNKEHAEYIINQLNSAYGTHIQLIGDTVKMRQSEIEKIKQSIEAKRMEVKLKIMEEDYQNALKNREEVTKKVSDAEKDLNDFEKQHYDQIAMYEQRQQEYTDALKSGSSERVKTAKDELTKFENNNRGWLDIYNSKKSTLNEYNLAYQKNSSDIISYENGVVAASKGNTKEFNKIFDERHDNLVNKTAQTLIDETQTVEDLTPENVLKWQLLARTDEREYALALDKLDTDTKNAIMDSTRVVVDETDVLAAKFAKLGEKSENEFMDEFAKLPPDLQSEVVDKMNEKGYAISEEIQKGINKINPTVKVKADTSGIVKAIETTIKGRKYNMTTDANGVVKINPMADGGFLNNGEMFVAREAGPELVGRIGNRTAVANNDQIVNSIAKGLAMSGIGKDTNVTIVAKEKAGLLDYIEFEQQKRNRQYGL